MKVVDSRATRAVRAHAPADGRNRETGERRQVEEAAKAATRQGAQLRKWRGGRNGRCWLLLRRCCHSHICGLHGNIWQCEKVLDVVWVCARQVLARKMWNFRVIFITLVVLAGVPNILAYVEVRICRLLLLFEPKVWHLVG